MCPTGYIDLSKRRVSPEDIQKCEEKYNKSKQVHSIMRHVSETCKIRMEELYHLFGWDLYKRFGHAEDAFKLALGYATFRSLSPPSLSLSLLSLSPPSLSLSLSLSHFPFVPFLFSVVVAAACTRLI